MPNRVERFAREAYAALLEEGALPAQADVLQPADRLLDLYGEDIRARTYVVNDPLRGELMMRPDFTVPVVLAQMQTGAEPARYAYMGKVFRKQEEDLGRPNEYLQVGYEVFDRADPVGADIDVFVRLYQRVAHLGPRVSLGDIGMLTAAVNGLGTTDARKAALLRHIWRPRRFRALLERFGGITPMPPSRVALLASADPFAGNPEELGVRSRAEVEARIAALKEDAAEPPIAAEEIALIEALVNLRAPGAEALEILRDLAVDLPAIASRVSDMERRFAELEAAGVNMETLRFEGSYGRVSMEYYDGFVFGIYAIARPDLPPLATGGRYDALTTQLGDGRSMPAIGGILRPSAIVSAEEAK